MPRNLGCFNQNENCFFLSYGIQAARIYSQDIYCKEGYRNFIRNNSHVDECRCPDWHLCKYFLHYGGEEPKPTRPVKRMK